MKSGDPFAKPIPSFLKSNSLILSSIKNINKFNQMLLLNLVHYNLFVIQATNRTKWERLNWQENSL